MLLVVVAIAIVTLFIGCTNSPVAIVNDVRITEAEFNKRMVTAVGSDILKDMIDRQLLQQAADASGIVVDETEFQQEVERAKQGFPSEEAFQGFLTGRSLTEEDWLAEVHMALVARELMHKDVAVTEEALKAFFAEHKDRYDLPVRVSVSEIVVATKADADEVLAQLKQDPDKFADLARVYSLSPYTKSRGGKRPEDMPVDRIQSPEVRGIVTTLPVGEISGAMRVTLGEEEQWYILRVDDRKAARTGDFAQDKEQIERDYQSVNATPLPDILKAQAAQSNVVIIDPRFQSLNEAYSSVSPDIPDFGGAPAPADAGDVIADPPADAPAGQ